MDVQNIHNRQIGIFSLRTSDNAKNHHMCIGLAAQAHTHKGRRLQVMVQGQVPVLAL